MKRIYNKSPGFKETRHKQESPEAKHESKIKSKLKLFKNFKGTTKRVQLVLKQIAESDFICTHEYLIKLTGGNSKMALVVSYILYMEDKLVGKDCKDCEWFILKYDDIVRMTGVTRKTIHTTMNWLRDFGIIDTERRGVPAMQHYKLYKDVLVSDIVDCLLDNVLMSGIQI